MALPLGLLLVLQQPIIVDSHIDTPQRMLDLKADISAQLPVYPVFLDEHFWHQYDQLRRRLGPELDSIRARHRGRPGESAFEIDRFVGERAESLDVPTIDRLLDHIEHAVQVMGIDHVARAALRRHQCAAMALESRDVAARTRAGPRGPRLFGRRRPQDLG